MRTASDIRISYCTDVLGFLIARMYLDFLLHGCTWISYCTDVLIGFINFRDSPRGQVVFRLIQNLMTTVPDNVAPGLNN